MFIDGQINISNIIRNYEGMPYGAQWIDQKRIQEDEYHLYK